MEILILYGSNDRYGASQVLINEIEALMELGHSVKLMVPFDGPLEQLLRNRKLAVDIVINSRMPIIRRSRPLDLFRFKYGKKQVKASDIVIVWTLALAPYVLFLILNHRRFYVSIHELAQSRVLSLIVKIFISPYDFPIQVNGIAVKNWLVNNSVQANRILISYPYFEIDCPRFPEKTISESYGVVGRLNGKKGHLEVAKAFNAGNLSKSSSLHLFGSPFVGQENELKRLLEFIACDNRIQYHGEVEKFSDASKHFSFLLSFPLQMESLGITPIEAVYHNIRVAGYADGGSREVFTLVDGIAIDRTKNVLDDVLFFFSQYANVDKLQEWNPKIIDISKYFSKTQRINRAKKLIDMVLTTDRRNLLAWKGSRK